MDITHKVKNTIQHHHLLQKSDRVIVGVSGGPDSMALLHILLALRHDLGIEIYAAHLNHKLRKNSDADERFVRMACERLKLSCMVGCLKKGELRDRGSLEEAAREKRLKFFFKAARKIRAQAIALGHTRDDLAETVLMRIIRGTGSLGLRGILPHRQIQGFRLIRPLLEISRPEIELFLKRRHIAFRLDPTNRTLAFFRNKIRWRLLPELERGYNQNIREVLANLSQILASDYGYLEAQAGKSLKKILRSVGRRTLTLRLRALQSLPVALERMVMRLALEQLKGNMNQIQFSHFRELEDLIHERPNGSVVHLPGGISMAKRKEDLVLRFRKFHRQFINLEQNRLSSIILSREEILLK